MSDKKKKKVDVRLDDQTFNEMLVVSWFLNKKRSDLVRLMIEFFRKNGSLAVDGQEILWIEVVELALAKLEEENMTLESLEKAKAKKLPEQLNEELKVFADSYAKEALEAYKRYASKGSETIE